MRPWSAELICHRLQVEQPGWRLRKSTWFSKKKIVSVTGSYNDSPTCSVVLKKSGSTTRVGSQLAPSSKLRRITTEEGVASVECTRACAKTIKVPFFVVIMDGMR